MNDLCNVKFYDYLFMAKLFWLMFPHHCSLFQMELTQCD
jgi:hypothetical protein